jgi:hypothetical protein
VDDTHLAALQQEARAGAAHARPYVSGDESLRDDEPVTAIDMAPGGAALVDLHHGPATFAALEAHTGARWQPLFDRHPSFLYYRRPSHFMSLHRDLPSCELTIITCVVDTPGDGGELILFPTRGDESLDALRATPAQGAVTVRLAEGESLLMCGHDVPHAVTPVAPGRTRVTASFFYRKVA